MLSKLTKLFGNKPDADSAADTMTLTDAQVLEAVAGLTDAIPVKPMLPPRR
jgi:ATP-binding protein involved in chromosome partitioning